MELMFPVNVYVKEYVTVDNFFWKFLCIVFDNEALGLIQRQFGGLELKMCGSPVQVQSKPVIIDQAESS